MPRTPQENRALFDQWSQKYDVDVKAGSFPLGNYATSREQALTMLSASSGDHILDIGTGTGDFAALLAEQGAIITAVDLSPAMLEKCKAKYPTFECHLGQFTDLPVRDAAFDGVITSFAFHEVPLGQRLNALTEMARVLKPGGLLCILDVMFASDAAMNEAEKVLGRFWDPDEDYALVPVLDATAREAGFHNVRWSQTEPLHWAMVARLRIP